MSAEYIEYTIKIKDEKSTMSEKDISYEPLELSKHNAVLAHKVNELAKRFFEGNELNEPPEVVITCKMVWQS